MEKLLQLLNEHSPLEDKNQEYCIDGADLYIKTKVYSEADEYLNYTPRVISKKFGFVQWLVEKRKLEQFLCPDIIKEVEVDASEVYGGCEYYSDVDSLLMILAIQDDPISFLVSILK